MGLSVNEFTYEGVDEFDLNFALGYASRSDIQCYKNGDGAGLIPVDIEFNWLTDSQVRIVDHDLELGDKLTFTRTVSKVELPVDLAQPSQLTRENVTTAVSHSLYAMHELLDGRYGDVVNLDDTLFNLLNQTVETALSNFLFSADFIQDIVIKPSLTGEEVVTYTSGNRTGVASEVLIFVETPPNVPIEVIVYNNADILFYFTVGTGGEITNRSTSDLVIAPGSLSVRVTGSNYVSGAQLGVVLPIKHTSVIDFDTELTDYVDVFEEARTT